MELRPAEGEDALQEEKHVTDLVLRHRERRRVEPRLPHRCGDPIDERTGDPALALRPGQLAAGTMFGDAFIDLLPEAYARTGATFTTSLCTLAGILLLRWRHEHPLKDREAVSPVGYMNVFADAIHNLIDGVLIGASYSSILSVGLATTAAVILHEIPQEIGDFGVLLQAGFTRKQALSFNFLSASLAIVGAVITLIAGATLEGFSVLTLLVTAGGFIYIAGCDLLPELQKEVTPVRSIFAAMASGVGLMLMLVMLE
jgi:zinc and cadmium transporter